MRYLIIALLFITLLSCKKEENSAQYWRQKTTETHNKLVSLSDKYSCEEMPNISIKPIKEYTCTFYVLVHKNDEAKFDKLINEYEYYHKKLIESDDYIRMSILCSGSYPVRIDCKEGKSKIVYLEELNLEELQVEIANLYDDIKKHYENTPCINPNDWLGITLQTVESVEAIAIKKGDTNFTYKVNTYNQAIIRKLRSEGKEIEFDTADKVVVKCENNKAIAAFE